MKLAIKYTLIHFTFFLISLFTINSFSQNIAERNVDKDGDIFIQTTKDTIAKGENSCLIRGVIYTSDSISYFGNVLYLKVPRPIFLSSNDMVVFHLENGEIIERPVMSDGEFYPEEANIMVTVLLKKRELLKLKKTSINSINLVNKRFQHTIVIDKPFQATYTQLADLLLSTNVYDTRLTKNKE
ncbi:MAG: hypothetical protein FGM46_01770 [Ferruginibacter sp.]|nr:hypothetical protein [Ferruginibacter sp.]